MRRQHRVPAVHHSGLREARKRHPGRGLREGRVRAAVPAAGQPARGAPVLAAHAHPEHGRRRPPRRTHRAPALPADDVAAAINRGAIVLDTRSAEAFGGGHIPGALNVGLGSAFATWAGTVLPAEAEILLVLDRSSDLWEAIWQLLRIGYPMPTGWLAGGMSAWRTSARPVELTPQITVHELKRRLDQGEVTLLDVRQPAEWAAGHTEGATFITGAELPDRLDEVPADKPIAVTCGSGYRSSVATSLLARERGLPVINVAGGMTAWHRAGYPTT
ncbi:rhodanese-like domain-containing protein [Prauserella oleivorans]